MSELTEAGMISSNGNIILFILDSLPFFTDRYGFEGVILGYGFYDIWTEEHKLAGEIQPTLSGDGITIRSGGMNYFSSKAVIEMMLSGERKTAPVMKKRNNAFCHSI